MNIPINALGSLLGEENVENIQERISNMIVERIQSDIDVYDQYIFYPPDYQEFFDECFEEAKNKVKETIVQKMYDDMMKAYKSKGYD